MEKKKNVWILILIILFLIGIGVFFADFFKVFFGFTGNTVRVIG